jgi:hypothetical protein
MEPGGSLPHSQEPATCPYPEPAQSISCSPSQFLKIYFNIILPSTPNPVAILKSTLHCQPSSHFDSEV